MKTVLVCGSRNLGAQAFGLAIEIDAFFQRLQPCRVIHGAAPGIDRIAAQAAALHGHKVEAFPADWETHGKRAGVLRNLQMLDERPDLVVAWWDGKSPGTKHTLTEADKRGIPVQVATLNLGAA